MRARLPVPLGLALVLLAPAPAAEGAATEFHAVIDGTQAIPPNNSSARGIGRFTLDETQTQLAYDITFDLWVTSELFSHIHVSAAGNNGADAILEDLPNGNPKVGVMAVEPAALIALLGGFLYVNVHTDTYRQGEIAGYLVPGTPAAAGTWGRLKALYL